MRPVKPGDLLILDTGLDVELVGVVTAHYDDISLVSENVWEYQQLEGPGVSIYWQASNTMALWLYSRLAEEIIAGRLKQVETREL